MNEVGSLGRTKDGYFEGCAPYRVKEFGLILACSMLAVTNSPAGQAVGTGLMHALVRLTAFAMQLHQ